MLKPYDPSEDYPIKLVFTNSDEAFVWYLQVTNKYFPCQSMHTFLDCDGTLWLDVK
jgi:hypothetical protein